MDEPPVELNHEIYMCVTFGKMHSLNETTDKFTQVSVSTMY